MGKVIERLRALVGIKGSDGSTIASPSNPLPVSLAGADIQEPVDIQGSTIQVPVDIQGATVQVPSDIQGSTIQVPSDIQGASIQVPVDIQSVFRPLIISDTTPRGSNAIYASAIIDVSEAEMLSCVVEANAPGTLSVEQSEDGTNFDDVVLFPFSGAAAKSVRVPINLKSLKVRVLNGASAQTIFRLYAHTTVN